MNAVRFQLTYPTRPKFHTAISLIQDYHWRSKLEADAKRVRITYQHDLQTLQDPLFRPPLHLTVPKCRVPPGALRATRYRINTPALPSRSEGLRAH